MLFDEAAHRGKYRLLYAFAPDDEHPDFLAQQQMISGHDAGFRARNLLFIEVLERGESRAGKQLLAPESVQTLRRNHGIDDGRFVLVLVGLDGTEMARSTEPVPIADVFEQIDQVPMHERDVRTLRRRGA